MPHEYDYMSAAEMRLRVARKDISPVELTGRALDRAAETELTLNAFLDLYADSAAAAAQAAEDAVMRGGPLGALHGIPISVKDLIAVGGERFTFGSKVMAENVAPADSPAVERARAAGAVVIGKTTTSEFGCKPVGDSPLTGVTRNPWNTDKTPGGSSAGAGASIAAGVTPFGLGTDGGGSIRIPSSLTGLAGIKGSFARVPVWPTTATPTLAHVGPMARSVRDAAMLFAAIAGYDARDPFGIAGPVPDVVGACDSSVEGMRVAWSSTLGYARPDAEVVGIVEAAVRKFEDAGATVELVEDVFEGDPGDLWTAEFYAGVGIKLRDVLREQRDILDPAVADILEPALGQEMQDYYTKVFERYALRERMAAMFEKYDVLISPVLPVSSVDVGVNVPASHPDRNLVSWVYYTYPFNLTGQPAGSVCAGIASDGMPVGLQAVGRYLDEASVVRALAFVERSQPPGYNICNYDA
ncbi:MAG: amidase [Alphaproteobacteria bacterium]|nr:amidase [Alphaproteobacteria bacterium]